MSYFERVDNAGEMGVFAWIKVPRHVASPEASYRGFTVDFRVSCCSPEAGRPDEVTPSRPVGKAMPARPGVPVTAEPRLDAAPDDDAIEVAVVRRKEETLKLSLVPVEESCNGAPFDTEFGPLSFAQGWLDGEPQFKGETEEAGFGLEWRRHAAALVLISLISEDACPSPQVIDPSGDAIVGAECGVFAWLGLPKDDCGIAARDEAVNTQRTPLLVVDFRATFAPWRPGKLRGVVCPPDPVEMDIRKPLVRLASVNLAQGRWTLYAKGPARVPANLKYRVVSGPRSEARHWLGTADGDQWRAGVDPVALVTLTSHAVPL